MAGAPLRGALPAWSLLPRLLLVCLLPGTALESSSRFLTPQLTPRHYLLVSSTRDRRVVWTPLRNFKGVPGSIYPLIDSGLDTPRGLAYSKEQGALFVADSGARKIYYYRVYVINPDDPRRTALATDRIRVTILQNVSVSWVAVDKSGDVFYSDPDRSTVGKIPNRTVASLTSGMYGASDLSFLSEMELVKMARQSVERRMQGIAPPPEDPQAVSTLVHRLYEGSREPFVASPGGVATDGTHVYWTNMASGRTNGSAVRGFMEPTLPPGAHLNATLEASAVSNRTQRAFGIAKSRDMLVFGSGDGRVYGLSDGNPQVATLSTKLSEPRGLVWDGDNTVFVADELRDTIWSLPIGRLATEVPLDESVRLTSPFGLALVTVYDRHGASGPSGGCSARCPRGSHTLSALFLAWLSARRAGV